MCQTNTGDIFKVIGKGVSFVGEKVGGRGIAMAKACLVMAGKANYTNFSHLKLSR
jgi:hypothetical protein